MPARPADLTRPRFDGSPARRQNVRHMTAARSAFLAICMTIASVPAALAAKPAPEPIAMGPFHLGMTFDEARAAAPQLAWQEVALHDNPYRKALLAPDALEIGGLRYNVHIEPGWYGAYTLTFFRTTPADNPEACAKAAEALFAELESRFGTFVAGEARDKQTKTQTRRAGKASRYTWLTTPNFSEASAVLHRDGAELLAHGAYVVKNLRDEWECEAALKISAPGHAPESELIAESKLKPDLEPSLGVLHNTTEQVEFPSGGFSITSQCKISRESGKLEWCKGDPSHPKAIGAAIAARSYHLAFATDSLEPGNPVPLYSNLTFRFEPTQRLSLASPTEVVDEHSVSWSEERTKPPVDTGLPSDEKYYEHGTVTVACQIQADGSLACRDAELTLSSGSKADAPLTERFLFKARTELQYRRAARELADGSRSAGRWISMTLPLRIIHL
jgi:hypothetical protein